MANIKWLPEALEDVQRLYDFLYSKDVVAAKLAASCILKGSSLIKASPRIGRPMPDESGRREVFVSFGAGAYVLRYRLDAERTAIVIRVWHSKESRAS